jgi:hypothetical protein
MSLTIKVEIITYVGLEKYSMESLHTWDSTDGIGADEMAMGMVDHVAFKMNAALSPCFYTHQTQVEENEEA